MTIPFLSRLTAAAVILSTAAIAIAVDPQPTNHTSFDIPFVVETSSGADAAGTALLFMSVDGGPMEQTQRVPASAGSFHFTASSDGTYGFAVRMTDESGRMIDDSRVLEPELLVRVDTAAPALKIQLSEIAAGQVNVVWDCGDPQVAPGSVRLEFAEGADGRWKPIDGTTSSSGQTVLEVAAGTSVSVRGFLTDLAGNQGTGSSQIVLQNSAAKSAPQKHDPISASKGAQSGAPGGALGDSPFIATVAESRSTHAPAESEVPFQMPASAAPETSAVPQTQQLPLSQQIAEPTAADQYPAAEGYSDFSANAALPDESVAAFRSNAQQFSNMPAGSVNGLSPEYGGPATGMVINNRIFDIEYAVESVGPSGVGAVELFVTEDNGQQWFRYGSDADLQSPFQVDSRGEGTFGFAVRVRNGLGFSDPPPQPGDRPSIVVVVDQTPPAVNFGQPKVVFDRRGRVQIPWQITDASPGKTLVRLEYALSASGPWTPVFDWQPDTGGHDMVLQPGMPNVLFFRLLARDAAGNISTAQSQRPVLVDQQRPTARLLRVQPVSRVRTY